MGEKQKYKKSVYQTLAMITQFGISMLVPIFLCAFVGKIIDDKIGTSFWFVILFFVGALAGFRNIFIIAKKIYESDAKEDDFETIRKKLEQERKEKQKEDKS